MLAVLSLLLSLVLTCISASLSRGIQCETIQHRKEWRQLSDKSKASYLQSVLCLQKLPPREPDRRAVSRFEEFQETHILLTERIHSVGHFLPYHRHLITLYNRALREECGYEGPEPYWDWAIDGDSDKPMVKSPIFDPILGFGGDGVPGTYTLPPDPNNEIAVPWTYKGCVQDGPFALNIIHLGPGKMKTDHCLVRGIGDEWKHSVTSKNVEETLKVPTYEAFRLKIDNLVNGIHGGGHIVVGGEMTNIYSAGADPLFYLHHANLDRIWWIWQRADPQLRLSDVSGPTTQNGTVPVTLDFQMDYPALGPNVTVGEVMESFGVPECFSY